MFKYVLFLTVVFCSVFAAEDSKSDLETGTIEECSKQFSLTTTKLADIESYLDKALGFRINFLGRPKIDNSKKKLLVFDWDDVVKLGNNGNPGEKFQYREGDHTPRLINKYRRLGVNILFLTSRGWGWPRSKEMLEGAKRMPMTGEPATEELILREFKKLKVSEFYEEIIGEMEANTKLELGLGDYSKSPIKPECQSSDYMLVSDPDPDAENYRECFYVTAGSIVFATAKSSALYDILRGKLQHNVDQVFFIDDSFNNVYSMYKGFQDVEFDMHTIWYKVERTFEVAKKK